jgi:glycosyltransferase involved in cell wall biosynthesis
MRVHLHDYAADDLHGKLDGAVLMHSEMASLLASRHEVVPHDLRRGRSVLAGVRSGDVVYAGCGPYAYLYHLWREHLGTSFRIVREVHTTLWSGFWAQEELCAPYLRPGDIVLFPTEFARRLFITHLPGVELENSGVAYPMLHRLPRRTPKKPSTSVLRIGYLGALSDAKNFDQVIAVFAACYRESGGRASLTFAGKPSETERHWNMEVVQRELAGAGVHQSAIVALGTLAPMQLVALFDAVDVLLFPSTASRESLGRVIIEALAHGVPVVAPDVGPPVELLPTGNLFPTDLKLDRSFTMGRVEALGRIDAKAATEMLLARNFQAASIRAEHPYSPSAFWHALEGHSDGANAGGFDATLLHALEITPRPPLDAEQACLEAETVFAAFHERRDAYLLRRIREIEQAQECSRDDLRTLLTRRRNLADYRGLPRLIDALVLPSLPYTLRARA